METILKMILEALYCLVALGACGMFITIIFTDIRKEQRDAEIARRREEREEEYHRKQMESYRR